MTENTANKLDLKLVLLFIPVAYASYLFHEFGHWLTGEIFGNDMSFSLNISGPKSGSYLHENDNLFASIGGPAFTILFALIFLLLIRKYKSIYLYPVVFFQFFTRFFSLLFGGLAKQDEARISVLLDLGKFTIPVLSIIILLSFTWMASRKLKIDLRTNGYYFVISTVCIVLVIGTAKLTGSF